MIAFLSRKYEQKQTVGSLVIFDENDIIFQCLTKEPPWKGNQKNISCIPEREYNVVPHTSPKYGFCLMVENVPNRSYILFHWGNYYDETEGCILVGDDEKDINHDSVMDLINSKNTFIDLIKNCPEGFKLIITSENPDPD